MDQRFSVLGIEASLEAGLEKEGIVTPTPIQTQAIPEILAGKDVVGKAATGTGKTLAYLLPLFQKIRTERRETQAIILAPTHELAMQIQKQMEILIRNSGCAVTAIPLIGNVNIARQVEKLKEKPHIVVGSCGRVLELIQKKKINPTLVKTIVLDEADRLLADNSISEVRSLIKTTMKDRQVLMFSATMPKKTVEAAGEFLQRPFMALLEEHEDMRPDIAHWYVVADRRDKVEVLRKLAGVMKVERALVFVNQNGSVEWTAAKLNYHGAVAAGLYSGADKTGRQRAMEEFRKGRVRLLIASDLAARGLDVEELSHVINLDMPEDPQVYLHRTGRTGRAGKKGIAVSVVAPGELECISRCEKILGVTFQAKVLSRGRLMDREGKK